MISDWTYQKFHEVATWVFEQKGHFGRIDVALDDRNGVIDVDRIYASVKAGNCVSHRSSRWHEYAVGESGRCEHG